MIEKIKSVSLKAVKNSCPIHLLEVGIELDVKSKEMFSFLDLSQLLMMHQWEFKTW